MPPRLARDARQEKTGGDKTPSHRRNNSLGTYARTRGARQAGRQAGRQTADDRSIAMRANAVKAKLCVQP